MKCFNELRRRIQERQPHQPRQPRLHTYFGRQLILTAGQLLLSFVLLGALFVGVGVGLIVRQGGSSGGDDALALSIAKAVKCRISYAYLFTDLTVLTLSLSYIPFKRIAYSLITVTLSSWIIDFFQKGKKNT